jgi:hypothetical protein
MQVGSVAQPIADSMRSKSVIFFSWSDGYTCPDINQAGFSTGQFQIFYGFYQNAFLIPDTQGISINVENIRIKGNFLVIEDIWIRQIIATEVRNAFKIDNADILPLCAPQ